MFYKKSIKFFILGSVLCLLVWKGHIFLKQDSCIDNGNVWDYQEKRCRKDCLAWNKINGCIKMTKEQIKLFDKCRYQPTDCVPKTVFNEICLNNKLSLNKETGECDMEFTIDKCHKLGEQWIYPDSCQSAKK